jgi:hypothetical protein
LSVCQQFFLPFLFFVQSTALFGIPLLLLQQFCQKCIFIRFVYARRAAIAAFLRPRKADSRSKTEQYRRISCLPTFFQKRKKTNNKRIHA